ncbi:unnamed protein product [Thlaspi arvense]|uniref:Neprosin PEP catalytic domain-containing protein n=1 Tax=Thlaspi arvense TaxID=13288 RepID=A0AAU9SL61_THLAR|nr:unnamed protein product [Thlaspi arvense]
MDAQPWQLAGECPENTIPVKRVTKEDLLRVDNINNYGKKTSRTNISQPHQFYHPTAIGENVYHEYATTSANGVFRGAKAQMNVWKPRIQEARGFSLSQIWVVGGNDGPGLNTIEAGWHADPDLHGGDASPRIFIFWTSDGYHKAGCYNHLCSGFVQTNKRIALGALLKPISTYNGPQFLLIVQIWKDPKSGNWWLQLNEKELMGYWPKELLPNLANAARTVEWGGEVVNIEKNGQHTTTEMGSGHFPSEGFGKASHFRVVKIIDTSNVIRDPVRMTTVVSKPTCYNLKNGYSRPWGVFFYYGGPGRNPRCH